MQSYALAGARKRVVKLSAAPISGQVARAKEVLREGPIGRLLNVEFEWCLNGKHGVGAQPRSRRIGQKLIWRKT